MVSTSTPSTLVKPEWMTEEGYRVLKTNYLLPGEEPVDMYRRVANASAYRLKRPELADRFFELMWKGWLCPATPVLTNMGTERGLPISCYGLSVSDYTYDILYKSLVQGMMSKGGGGVGIYLGNIRARGEEISVGGTSHGVVSWTSIYQQIMTTVSQGGIRRGAAAVYLPVEHGDFEEFLHMRRAQRDMESSNKSVKNELIHHGICLSDEFMESVLSGDPNSCKKFADILKTRMETGEPYVMYPGNANRQKGVCYENLGLDIVTSQICTEIFLFTDENHSFVCCLSSMNALKFSEWSTDPRAVRDSIWFLDGVMQEFIDKLENPSNPESVRGMETALAFAKKSRALGLGVLGLHSLYQANGASVGSFLAKNLNKAVFKHLYTEAQIATKELAEEYGEPEWCKGTGRRNTHMIAVAPTVSNSIISGQVTPGIEPFPGNVYGKRTAQGLVPLRNAQLDALLKAKLSSAEDVETVWESITHNEGSVQHLGFLTDNEREVFRTAREIPQHLLIQDAADRQPYIDQGQSVNLFVSPDVDPKYFAKLHIDAWRLGLKSLYYTKSKSARKADAVSVPSVKITAQPEAELDDEEKYPVCESCSG